jgi:acyl dehydratase
VPESPTGAAVRLSFDRPPGSAAAFVRALFDRRPGRLPEGGTAPCIVGAIDRLAWRDGLLGRYSHVCGFPLTQRLPLTFPHIVGAGLHLRMLLHREFPVRLPGLVHVWHKIRQSQPIISPENLAMECSIEGHREVDAGAEFCLNTKVISDGRAIWEEQTGFIARASRRSRPADRSRPGDRAVDGTAEPDAVMDEVTRIAAAADVGRRYALASGDYNPIHLSAACARPFGFPRPIAHGMWTLARSVAELQARGGPAAVEVSVRFRRPVFLPATLQLEASAAVAAKTTFRVLDADSGIVCLTGTLGQSSEPGEV